MYNANLYGAGGLNGYGYGARNYSNYLAPQTGDISGYNAYQRGMQPVTNTQTAPVAQAPAFNPYPQPQQPNFVIQPVTNQDEAKAVIPEPMTTYLFPDASTGKIYMKRMSSNGASEFYTYVPEPQTAKDAKIETTEIQSNQFDEMNKRLINIETILGGMQNDKSVSNAKPNAKSNAKHDAEHAGANAAKDASAQS